MNERRTLWALHLSFENGEVSMSLHKTKREAKEEIAAIYNIDTEDMTDEQLNETCDQLGVWATLMECEVPE